MLEQGSVILSVSSHIVPGKLSICYSPERKKLKGVTSSERASHSKGARAPTDSHV